MTWFLSLCANNFLFPMAILRINFIAEVDRCITRTFHLCFRRSRTKREILYKFHQRKKRKVVLLNHAPDQWSNSFYYAIKCVLVRLITVALGRWSVHSVRSSNMKREAAVDYAQLFKHSSFPVLKFCWIHWIWCIYQGCACNKMK